MINIDTSSRKEQRKFGLVMAAAICLLGLVRFALHGFAHFPVWFFAVAAVFAAFGLLLPGALRPVFVAWIKFAEGMNWVMTRLFLGIAFYLIITPMGLVMRMVSPDPLKRAWLPPGQTYWEDPDPQPEDLESFRNMF